MEELRANFEQPNRKVGTLKTSEHSAEPSKWKKFIKHLKNFIKTSRFAGVPFAIFYGIFIYYYVNLLVLSDPPVTVSESNDISSNS